MNPVRDMKVLSIGLDKRILDRNSAIFKRFKEYALLVDELYVVVFAKKAERFTSGSLFVYGSGGDSKIKQFLKAYKIAKRIIIENCLPAGKAGKLKIENCLITTQDPFFSGFLGYLLKRKFDLKLHVQLHSDFFGSKYFRKESSFNRFRYFLGKFVLKKADSFRVVSRRIKNSLVGLGISEEKITVVPISL